jgi:hypothetical protein
VTGATKSPAWFTCGVAIPLVVWLAHHHESDVWLLMLAVPPLFAAGILLGVRAARTSDGHRLAARAGIATNAVGLIAWMAWLGWIVRIVTKAAAA